MHSRQILPFAILNCMKKIKELGLVVNLKDVLHSSPTMLGTSTRLSSIPVHIQIGQYSAEHC